MIWLSCSHFGGSCCWSCHEDDDEGYGTLCELEHPFNAQVMASVCCCHLELDAKDWNEALDKYNATS